MSKPFIGRSLALSSGAFQRTVVMLGVKAAELWALLEVETSGCGFLPDRRPKILFERHVFHRLTEGQYDDGDISDQTPGGYGAEGAHQYDRLQRAMAKDRTEALKSTSWGLGQVMGFNFESVGFADVESMVTAMADTEESQVSAIASFLIDKHLDAALRSHDWATFARGYNGEDYARNQYDAKLRGDYQSFSTGALPDIAVRQAQLYLTYAGYHPGPIDGNLGRLTRSAVIEFRSRNNLAPDEKVDEEFLQKLSQVAFHQ